MRRSGVRSPSAPPVRLFGFASNAGAGLGLAISRQIIERFGGQIYCADTKTGATFVVRLLTEARRG